MGGSSRAGVLTNIAAAERVLGCDRWVAAASLFGRPRQGAAVASERLLRCVRRALRVRLFARSSGQRAGGRPAAALAGG